MQLTLGSTVQSVVDLPVLASSFVGIPSGLVDLPLIPVSRAGRDDVAQPLVRGMSDPRNEPTPGAVR